MKKSFIPPKDIAECDELMRRSNIRLRFWTGAIIFFGACQLILVAYMSCPLILGDKEILPSKDSTKIDSVKRDPKFDSCMNAINQKYNRKHGISK